MLELVDGLFCAKALWCWQVQLKLSATGGVEIFRISGIVMPSTTNISFPPDNDQLVVLH
jgi:hypothetical protein